MSDVLNYIIKKYNSLKRVILMLDVKLFFVLHILCGQHIQIHSSKPTSIFLRCYCICVAVLNIYFGIMHIIYSSQIQIETKLSFIISTLVVEYVIWCLISQITGHACISTYMHTIFLYDSLMAYKGNIFTIKNVFLLMIFDTIMSLLSLSCDLFVSEFWAEMLAKKSESILILLAHHLMSFVCDMAALKIILVVGLLQNRLMLLRKTLMQNVIPVNIYRKVEIHPKMQVVQKCALNYHDLLDAFGNIDGHMQLTMFINLIFNVYKIIVFGYFIIKQSLLNQLSSRIVVVDLVRMLSRVVTPCVICELCGNEVYQLKILLTKQIIRCSDSDLCAELHRMLSYVSRRPFSFTLLRALRVDAQLPVTVGAFCLTYIVLLTQLTQFAY